MDEKGAKVHARATLGCYFLRLRALRVTNSSNSGGNISPLGLGLIQDPTSVNISANKWLTWIELVDM